MDEPFYWDLTEKKATTKSVRIPDWLIEELEAIASENTIPSDDPNERVIYTFTDVTIDFLTKGVRLYRQRHPRLPRPASSDGQPESTSARSPRSSKPRGE